LAGIRHPALRWDADYGATALRAPETVANGRGSVVDDRKIDAIEQEPVAAD